MATVNYFDVAGCAPTSELTGEEASSAWGFTRAARWKGSDARARLCVRGLKQPVKNSGSTFASKPRFAMLKLLIMPPSSFG